MSDNPSFVLHGIEHTAYEQRPIPAIADHDVLVQVRKTGICGSDVHYLLKGRIAHFVVKKPMVLGHESSGVVSKIGSKVTTLKPGDRVTMEPGVTCRVCDACKTGRYELCPDIVFAATPPYDGTLARYFRIPADLAYPLPDHVSLEDGALIEPLAVAVHSVSNLGSLRVNQSIAVFGCGPVGLLCMAVARAVGASRVIAIDVVPSRLEFAKSYAATEVFAPSKPQDGESMSDYSERNAEEMKKCLGLEQRGSKALDLVLEASGAEMSLKTGILILKTGGTLVQVGMGNPEVSIDVGQIITRELTIKGSFRYGPGDYPLAIALVAQGKIDLKPLITHRYAFNDAIAAFDATKKGKSKDGKGVIKAIISGPDVAVDSG